MKNIVSLLLILTILFANAAHAQEQGYEKQHEKQYEISEGYDKIIFTGKIQTFHKEPIAGAKIKVIINGEVQPIILKEGDKERKIATEYSPNNEIESSSDGEYTAIVLLPKNTAEKANIKLHIEKPTYAPREIEIHELTKISGKEGEYIHYENITPERNIGPAFYISAIVLILIYILISFEILHRTHAALLGAAVLLFVSYVFGHYNPDFFILSFESAKNYIDFNVILLLLGMMLIVGVMKRTGIFQWIAFKSYQIAKGDAWKLTVILMTATAFTSAFLDNVTTMLLLTPVSIEIALILRISPWSFLLPEVLASNLGGTATLIGDPPNIIIGSYANLTFLDFIIALTPVVVISMVALTIMMKRKYGAEYKKAEMSPEKVSELLNRLKEEYKITNMTLLRYSLAILFFVIGLFVLHGVFHMEPCVPALIGAAILIMGAVFMDKVDVAHLIEREIEWPTLVFFMMLFVVVGAAEETGLIQMIAEWVATISGGNLIIAIILILWVAGLASAIVDNIPFTATMLPIVAYLSQVIPNAESNILWWALALGACFGGNATLIGASANVVTAGLSEKAGHPITFIGFFKVGFPVMVMTMIISTIWLLFIFPLIM